MKKVQRRRLRVERLEARDMLAPIAGGMYDVLLDPSGGNTLAEFDGRVINIGVKLLTDPSIGNPAATVSVASTVSPAFVNNPGDITFNGTNWNEYQFILIGPGIDDPEPGLDNDPYPFDVTLLSASNVPAFHNKSGWALHGYLLDDDIKAIGVWNGATIAEDSGETLLDLTKHVQDKGGNDSWSLVSGSVSVSLGNGSIIGTTERMAWFQPDADWYGNYEITWSVVNEYGKTGTGTYHGKVINVPDAPLAENDEGGTTSEGQAITIDVLANDTDRDNDPVGLPLNNGLKILSVSAIRGGTPYIVGNQVLFEPDPNFNDVRDGGTAEFSYICYDEYDPTGFNSEAAYVTVSVTPKNVVPRAAGGAIQVDEDSQFTFAFNDDGGDGDEYAWQSLAYYLVTPPAHGEVDFNTMTYTPDPNWDQGDSFEYRVTDDEAAGPTGGLDSDVATVAIMVNPVNDSPTALDAFGSCDEDSPATIDLAGFFDDIDDSVLLLSVDHPYASLSGTVVTYTPPADFNGQETFGFMVTDAAGASAWASITVTVNPVNDNPVAESNEGSVHAPETSTYISVLYNDSDIDGDEIYIVSVTQGSIGSVSFSGGNVTYTADASWTDTSSDSFEYTIEDGHGGTATAAVFISASGSFLAFVVSLPPPPEPTPSDPEPAPPEEFALVIPEDPPAEEPEEEGEPEPATEDEQIAAVDEFFASLEDDLIETTV